MANEVDITVRSRDQTARGFDSAAHRATGLKGVLGRVGETAAGFLAANVVQKGFDAFKDYVSGSIEQSTRLGESMNAVQKIFGTSAPQILKWGKNNATSFGLSQQAFNELATPLGAGLKNAGLSMDEVGTRTIDLTKRAADMASVFNTSVPDALAAIQAGLRGEADPLERYGVGLTAAKVQAEALAETHKKLATDLTPAELATARLNLIMKQTASTEGDFKGTSDQLANATRIQQAKSEELQATIGQKLTPVMLKLNEAKLALVNIIATKVLPIVDQFTAWAQKNSGIVKVLAAIIGGVLVVALAAYTVAAAAAAVATIAATWPILLIIAAIALLVVEIYLLVKHWDKIWSIIKSVTSQAWHWITGAVSGLVSQVTGSFSKLVSGAKSKFNSMLAFVRSIPGKIKRGLGNLGRLLYNAGKDVIRGLVNGIKAMAGRAVSAAKGVVSDAVSGAKHLLGIGSPSKVAAKEIGEPIGQGVVVGLNRARGMVANAGASMAGAAIPARTTAASSGGGGGPVVLELRTAGHASGIDRVFLSWLQGALRNNPGVKLVTS